MSTSGEESTHVENKTPDENGCQTMEIESVRKKKIINMALMNNAGRAFLVRLTEEQRSPEEVRKGFEVLEDAYKYIMEILLISEELYSKENDMKIKKSNVRNGDDY